MIRRGEDERHQLFIERNPLKVLRLFGHSIKHLSINFSILNRNLCTIVENYLALYCSESTRKLYIVNNRTRIALEDLQNPLKKVTYFGISTGVEQSSRNIQLVNEKNLPKVNDIEVRVLAPYEDHSPNVHFENIENFTLRGIRIYEYPYSFGRLKHLKIDGLYMINDAFCEWIGEIQDLQTLQILHTQYLLIPGCFTKILNLPNVLSNLQEIFFEYSDEIFAEDIIRFLKISQNLRKLRIHMKRNHYKIRGNYGTFLEILSSNLDGNWKYHKEDICQQPGYYFSDLLYVVERIIDD